MPPITELFLYVMSDSEDEEHIIAFQSFQTAIPLIATDQIRVNSLRPIADSISASTGKPYRILRFTLAGEVSLSGEPIPIQGLHFEKKEGG